MINQILRLLIAMLVGILIFSLTVAAVILLGIWGSFFILFLILLLLVG